MGGGTALGATAGNLVRWLDGRGRCRPALGLIVSGAAWYLMAGYGRATLGDWMNRAKAVCSALTGGARGLVLGPCPCRWEGPGRLLPWMARKAAKAGVPCSLRDWPSSWLTMFQWKCVSMDWPRGRGWSSLVLLLARPRSFESAVEQDQD